MSNANGQEDFIAAGFHKLDESLISRRPPKIRFSNEFLDQPAEVQNIYLIKLAGTMNHAAALIQDERDELNELCAKKEKQLESLGKQMDQNNFMLQSEVTRMNEQRQQYHANVSAMNARIRELESGAVD